MTAAILAQVATMPLPEPDFEEFSRVDLEHGDLYTANQLRAARLEAAQMVLAAVQAQGKPVAEVMSGWSLVWFGREPLAKICAAHPELRIGSKLYTRPPAPFLPVNAGLLAALSNFAAFKPHQAPRGISGTVWADYLRQARAAIASAEAASKGTA